MKLRRGAYLGKCRSFSRALGRGGSRKLVGVFSGASTCALRQVAFLKIDITEVRSEPQVSFAGNPDFGGPTISVQFSQFNCPDEPATELAELN